MVDRKLGFALALWAFVLVTTDVAAQIQPNAWLFRDGRFYVNVNENLLLAGSLEDPFAARCRWLPNPGRRWPCGDRVEFRRTG